MMKNQGEDNLGNREFHNEHEHDEHEHEHENLNDYQLVRDRTKRPVTLNAK